MSVPEFPHIRALILPVHVAGKKEITNLDPIAPRLKKITDELSEAKDLLGVTYAKDGQLSLQLTTKIDMFFNMKQMIKKKYPHVEHVSNAWLKGWEIAYRFFKDIGRPEETIKSLHVGELPGSMILAIKTYFESRQMTLDWHASSLYRLDGGGKHICNDEYKLVEKFPERWLMDGKEHFGDMQSRADIEYQIGRITTSGKVRIFTSDLAIGTDKDFNSMEQINLRAYVGVVITAMHAMEVAPDTGFYIKCFTTSTPTMISLIKFLHDCFDDLYLFKPITSRPLNSEIYIVGLGFKGATEADIDCLWKEFEALPEYKGLYRADRFNDLRVWWPVTASFLHEHMTHITTIYRNQIIMLKYFYELFQLVSGASAGPEREAVLKAVDENLKRARYSITTRWQGLNNFLEGAAKTS